MFAEAALKMLKKKNQKDDKAIELAIKLEQKEREELEEELKSLREEVKKLQEPKDVQA